MPEDGKSEHELRDRQMIELLNELRVALPGVQILFAFLLTVPFAQGWRQITPFQKDVYYLTLIATAISTTCFIAPTAAHRLRFHKRDRRWVIETASNLAIAGLVFLALAIFGAVLLMTDYLFDGARVWIYSCLIGALIAGLWFARPLLRSESSGPQ